MCPRKTNYCYLTMWYHHNLRSTTRLESTSGWSGTRREPLSLQPRPESQADNDHCKSATFPHAFPEVRPKAFANIGTILDDHKQTYRCYIDIDFLLKSISFYVLTTGLCTCMHAPTCMCTRAKRRAHANSCARARACMGVYVCLSKHL